MTNETYAAAQNYLARLGQAEYQAGIRVHLKAGRKRSTYRHSPSEYHRDLVDLLGRDDEHAFKVLKGEQGYASVVGH
jgi:hypothetical protein